MKYNYSDISSLFMNCLINGANLRSLVNLTSEVFNTPVILFDINRLPIEYTESYPVSALNDHLNMRNQIFMNEHESIDSYLKSINELIFKGTPYIFSYKFVRSRYLNCSCIFKDKVLGILALPDIGNSIEKIDKELFEFIAKIFALALIINGCPTSKKDNSNHEFLWGLLNRKYPDSFLQSNILWNIFNNIKHYLILWYLPVDYNGNTISKDVLEKVDSVLKHSWKIPFEEGYVIMTDGSDTESINVLNKAAEKTGILIGSSNVYTDINDTVEQLRISQDVLTYAQKFGQKSGLAKYDDYKVYHLISFAKKHMDVKEIKYDILNTIDKYDSENNSEYGITLRTYLLCDLKFQETAEKLCIHKNTVSYRIKRINELFNLDFSDLKQVTTLYYSVLLEQ